MCQSPAARRLILQGKYGDAELLGIWSMLAYLRAVLSPLRTRTVT
jgi:hypothetical protein